MAQVVAAWTNRGLPAVGVAADVSLEAGRTAIFAQVRTPLQGLNLFVNNLIINVHKEFNDYTPVEYERLFQVNLFSTVEMCRAAYPWLKASDYAAIVNVDYVAGRFDVGTGAYFSLTKVAEGQLARNLTVEWAPNGIRMNTMNP